MIGAAQAEPNQPTIKPTDHDANREPYLCMEQLAIVEKYEHFLDYVYPIFLGMRRAHYIVRDRALAAAFGQVELLNEAGKANTLPRLYAADAGLASLRFYLRFFAAPGRKLISKHQHQTAAIQLAETGKMLGAWIRRTQTAKR